MIYRMENENYNMEWGNMGKFWEDIWNKEKKKYK